MQSLCVCVCDAVSVCVCVMQSLCVCVCVMQSLCVWWRGQEAADPGDQ